MHLVNWKIANAIRYRPELPRLCLDRFKLEPSLHSERCLVNSCLVKALSRGTLRRLILLTRKVFNELDIDWN